MKILIADKFEQIGRERLADLKYEVSVDPGLDTDSLPAALRGSESPGGAAPTVLIVRSTAVTEQAIAAGHALELIIRAGAGYDTIDVEAASRAGVFVANCPGKNAVAVAELAWSLILACDRRVPDQTVELRAGSWNKKEYGNARGLFGRTLGVIGLGTIAREVVVRARGFGMPVVAWSRGLTREQARDLGVAHAATPVEVAARADVVSIHVASTPETANLVDDAFIDAMRPGAYLINTSRGAVVDEQALARGIVDKGIRAGLDVYRGEPGTGTGRFETALAGMPGVYGTHHVGASTDQAQQAIAVEAVRIVEVYARTGHVDNCVNRAQRSAATCTLTVRHLNRPGVLARVFGVLGEAGINVEEMENLLYEGAHAARARIQLASAPTPQQLAAIRASCDHILSMELTELGGDQAK